MLYQSQKHNLWAFSSRRHIFLNKSFNYFASSSASLSFVFVSLWISSSLNIEILVLVYVAIYEINCLQKTRRKEPLFFSVESFDGIPACMFPSSCLPNYHPVIMMEAH